MQSTRLIARPELVSRLRAALARSPVVQLIGPRQCGKTTAARWIVPANAPRYFDLEDPASLARLDQPMTALADLRGVVVIDEIQHRPDLFPILRVLADRRPRPAQFLVLGSASPALLRQSAESLAGRIETVTMGGLRLDELGAKALSRHWRRGGFPPAYLARSDGDSVHWRQQFIQTFLERDVPSFGIRVPAATLLRFWTMMAHYHGNIWNAAEPARSLGVSQPTVRHYLDLFTDLFMVRQLLPWHENLLKRQVKAPKILIRDSGLLHQLLGLTSERDLLRHPKLGSSWEGYAIEQVLAITQPESAWYWATHAGAELDLLLFRRGRRYGVEVKREDAPRLTPSMRIALQDLRLQHLTVLYPGSREYTLTPKVTVIPLASIASGDADQITPPARRRTVRGSRPA